MSEELLFLGIDGQAMQIEQPPLEAAAQPDFTKVPGEPLPGEVQARDACFAQEAATEDELLPPVHDRQQDDGEAGLAAMLMFYQLGGCKALDQGKRRDDEEDDEEEEPRRGGRCGC